MSGTIEVRALRVLGCHGALPHEQLSVQPFEMDLTVATDLEPSARSDQLSATVDYGGLVEVARAVVADQHFQLLEALAAAVADGLLAADSRVEAVTVTLRKLRPPLEADVESVGVRLTRHRGSAPPDGLGAGLGL